MQSLAGAVGRFGRCSALVVVSRRISALSGACHIRLKAFNAALSSTMQFYTGCSLPQGVVHASRCTLGA
eukprot:4114994-Alexandrium_andersonii.AAC.1